MAKKNGVKRTKASHADYLAEKQREAEHQKELWTMRVLAYTQQEMLDTMAIVLHDYYGFGEKRLFDWHNKFEEKYMEIIRLRNGDTDDLEYSEAKIEAALKAAWGSKYEPRSVRYDIRLVTPEGGEIKL